LQELFPEDGVQSTLFFRKEAYRRAFQFGKDAPLPRDRDVRDLLLATPIMVSLGERDWNADTWRWWLGPWWWWFFVIAIAAALLTLTRRSLRLVYLMEGLPPKFLSGMEWPDDPDASHTLVLRSWSLSPAG